jgi:hypothetical protein
MIFGKDKGSLLGVDHEQVLSVLIHVICEETSSRL